ncbi:hypothetical protein JW935_22220 [candidate division KSB1 bacterium]|nr:hypothetical protein [candidate division KSB1 bacterium]
MMKIKRRNNTILVLLLNLVIFTFIPPPAAAVFHPVTPQTLQPGAMAVSTPGNYTVPNTTYQLVQNISSPGSPIFLGKNMTLDLNGYTITYSGADYGRIPNYGFENDLEYWDTSLAPGAKIQRTDEVQIFIGEKLLQLSAGDEIVSEYIHLPIANRSYFAMCGVTHHDKKISLFIEDENGRSIECFSTTGDSTRRCCPTINRSPRLGGGFITAHMHGCPTGRYRIRVRAETDCLVDHIDLRPAMDVGIGIVEKTLPFAQNDDLYAGRHCAFFDFTKYGSFSEPLDGIARVEGDGTITIKNGVIKNGTTAILSWGIQSTAPGVRIILDNVKIVSSGINTNAVDVPQAEITNCCFEIDTPFIINRHVSEHAVVLRGPQPSMVSQCEIIGGQGCLTIMGENSDVFNNLFINRQTVTNHYSVMAMGDGSRIHHNRFKPEIGSGVEIYRHKRIQIFENEFFIEASPPTCEYGHEEYSTTAIRVADYSAELGSERGCADNRIFKNKFYITGRDYPQYPDYIPMAWAFFHSVSGGETYIYDNEIFVNHTAPSSKAEAAAIYIGGANEGGIWEKNRITTNVSAAWIASPYGSAKNAKFIGNTIILTPDSTAGYSPIRMGWKGRDGIVAENIFFVSNKVLDSDFNVDYTDAAHHFSVSWMLTIKVYDSNGQYPAEIPVFIRGKNGNTLTKSTDSSGIVKVTLKEYEFRHGKKNLCSPYTVQVGGTSKIVNLNKDLEISILIQ